MRTTRGAGQFVFVEQYWCLCCGTTEQAWRYQQLAGAQAHLASKTELHARGKCCGSCTRTAWLETSPQQAGRRKETT